MSNKNKFLYIGIFLVMVSFFVSKGVMAAGPAPSSVCGNGICEADETTALCPGDCSPCGDGVCDAEVGETPATCNVDCSGPVCGDGTCDDSESVETCPNDCSLPDPEPDPGTPTPSCEDVTIHVGEETTCSIKVENVQTFPLTEVTATVTIPNNITKVSNTDSWNCTATAEGTQCEKTYNPYLIMGEIEYLELTLTTDTEGTYGLSAAIEGQGETFQTVAYTSSEQITTQELATATAVEDSFMCLGNNAHVTNYDLSANDVLCSSGTTTFDYGGVHSGVTINAFDENTGIVSFLMPNKPLFGTLFFYWILCDGNNVASAAVSHSCS